MVCESLFLFVCTSNIACKPYIHTACNIRGVRFLSRPQLVNSAMQRVGSPSHEVTTKTTLYGLGEYALGVWGTARRDGERLVV